MAAASIFQTRSRTLRVVVLLLLGSCLTSFAQDLAALARKEKERRARLTKHVKVITEEDVKEAAAKDVGSLTVMAEVSEPAPSSEPGATPQDPVEAQKAAWKLRADSARSAVVAAEKKLEEMVNDLAKFRSDLTPVSAAEAQDPMRLQKREVGMVEMRKNIEAQRAFVAQAKKAQTEFEEEARRNGVPPGWLR